MSNATNSNEGLFSELPWMILYSSEGLLILAGNVITVFIFLKIRNNLRRTSYLLINLTVSDLMLSIAIFLNLWDGIANVQSKTVSIVIGDTAFVIDLLASSASLLSLTVISLERMFAILWPFRHRMLETWHYLTSISVLWVTAIVNVAFTSYLVFSNNLRYATTGISLVALLSIVITVASYLAIWIATKRNHVQNATSRSVTQNKKLAKTLSIVTILSLITWLPAAIGLAFPTYLIDAHSLYAQITLALQYANSFVNPFVYCFRMAEFQKALKKLCCRRRLNKRPSENIPLRATHGISLTFFKRY